MHLGEVQVPIQGLAGDFSVGVFPVLEDKACSVNEHLGGCHEVPCEELELVNSAELVGGFEYLGRHTTFSVWDLSLAMWREGCIGRLSWFQFQFRAL